MPYVVLISRAAARDYRRLSSGMKDRVRQAMAALERDPRDQAEKLAVEDAFRTRAGDYRIVFRVDDDAREVLVTRIKHRREVYRRR